MYNPCDSSYTPEPSTWSQNDWAASVGAVMMVLSLAIFVGIGALLPAVDHGAADLLDVTAYVEAVMGE